MNFFTYVKGELHCEQVPVEQIAHEVGTPVYVYSRSAFVRGYHEIARAFAPVNATICYSIKSCGNMTILRVLAGEGCGFDVTSAGELYRAVEAGGDPKKIIFAGVGRSDDEIRAASALRHRRVQSRIGSGDRKRGSHRRRPEAKDGRRRCASIRMWIQRRTSRPPPENAKRNSASISSGLSASSSSIAG